MQKRATTFTRQEFINMLPEGRKSANPTNISRLIKQLIEWGLLEKPNGMHNTYKFITKALEKDEGYTPL